LAPFVMTSDFVRVRLLREADTKRAAAEALQSEMMNAFLGMLASCLSTILNVPTIIFAKYGKRGGAHVRKAFTCTSDLCLSVACPSCPVLCCPAGWNQSLFPYATVSDSDVIGSVSYIVASQVMVIALYVLVAHWFRTAHGLEPTRWGFAELRRHFRVYACIIPLMFTFFFGCILPHWNLLYFIRPDLYG
jgi:hypothetical protein